MSVSSYQIELASIILRSRLTRPSTIDVVILDPKTADSSLNLSNLYGTFIGCFYIRPDQDICFILGARLHPEAKIDHIFVYYMNREYEEIQSSELELLRPFLAKNEVNRLQLRFCVINIKCSADPHKHLSVLIEAIDSTIGFELMNNSQSVQYIEAEVCDLSIGSTSDCRLDHCNGIPRDEMVLHLNKLAGQFRKSFRYEYHGSISCLSDLTLLRFKDHCVGLLYDKEERFVNHLLVHPNQYLDEEAFRTVKESFNRVCGMEVNHLCTRIVPPAFIRCDSEYVFDCWQLAVRFQPQVLTLIKSNELRLLLNKFEYPGDQECTRRTSARFRRYNPTEESGRRPTSQLMIDLRGEKALHRGLDSQATEVINITDWKSYLSTWHDVSATRRRIRDSLIPPVHKIEPYTDLRQSYLKDMPSFRSAIDLIGSIWDKYASTVVFFRPSTWLDRNLEGKEGTRFIIYVLEHNYDSSDLIVVADRQYRRWILMSPNNRECNDSLELDMSSAAFKNFVELEGFEGDPIRISSFFHKEYSRIHLLMSLYVISRLFRYSIELPMTVFYGESEFRNYASNICAELQYVNAEFNVNNGLIDEDGNLIEGAKESLPSPVMYTPIVTTKDKCMFCLRRKLSNLGSHMSMEHGCKAKYANRKRFERS